jgi:hypothetical protein
LTKTRKRNIIGFFILVAFVAFGYFMAYREDKGLKSNKTITTGTVYETTTYYQNPNSVFIKYRYIIDNKQFNGQSSIVSNHKYDDCKFLRQILLGHSFPIIYDSTDFDSSKILLSKTWCSNINEIFYSSSHQPLNFQSTRVVGENPEI